METESTPGNVRLNDGLGPLPEYAHEFRPRWFGDDGGFTGAQMRLYALEAVAAERARWTEAVMAERERCAQLCEQEICACCWDADAQAAAQHLAAEIRKGPNGQIEPTKPAKGK